MSSPKPQEGLEAQALGAPIAYAPVALAIFDLHMRYIAHSLEWRRMYNLKEDVNGRLHYDIFPEMPERWKQLHRRGLTGESVSSEDDEFIRSDGGTNFLRWKIWPWYDDAKNVAGIVIFSEDISAQKRTYLRKNVAGNKLKTEFRISHHACISRRAPLDSVYGKSTSQLNLTLTPGIPRRRGSLGTPPANLTTPTKRGCLPFTLRMLQTRSL